MIQKGHRSQETAVTFFFAKPEKSIDKPKIGIYYIEAVSIC